MVQKWFRGAAEVRQRWRRGAAKVRHTNAFLRPRLRETATFGFSTNRSSICFKSLCFHGVPKWLLFMALWRPGALSPARGESEARFGSYLQHVLDPLKPLRAVLGRKLLSRLGGVLHRAPRRSEVLLSEPKPPLG